MIRSLHLENLRTLEKETKILEHCVLEMSTVNILGNTLSTPYSSFQLFFLSILVIYKLFIDTEFTNQKVHIDV